MTDIPHSRFDVSQNEWEWLEKRQGGGGGEWAGVENEGSQQLQSSEQRLKHKCRINSCNANYKTLAFRGELLRLVAMLNVQLCAARQHALK